MKIQILLTTIYKVCIYFTPKDSVETYKVYDDYSIDPHDLTYSRFIMISFTSLTD